MPAIQIDAHAIGAHPVRVWQRIVAATVIACLTLLQGCATYLPARADTALAEQVEVGDRVRVTTVDGVKTQFVVTKVDQDGLYDESGYYRFADLTELRIEQKSPGSSAMTIAIVAIVAGVVIIVAFLNAIEDGITGAID